MKQARDLLLLVALLVSALAILPGGRTAATGAVFVDNATVGGNTFLTATSFPKDHYLHNNPTPPTGDTNSQEVLPLSSTAPTASILYNYDKDKDSFAGRLIKHGGNGAGEGDLSKYQAWRTGSLPEGQSLTGTVTTDLWTATKNFEQKAGEVTIFLRDYNGSTYTEIGNGTLYEANWQEGSATWVKKTISISGLNYTIPAGNKLEVKLIVTNNSAADLWFAYDTTSYPSVVKVPKVP